ncbi:hypothetical protein [Pseudomonas moraviensis]|uniref:hypothetical protein n=1 Tax=Pseudomonas moraviensis TaxID=321662 RepID=UPI000F78A61D|nr:hypothetical protein [Pseudomonas moraviensis]RRW59080.1 hypothetical protein EGJ55_02315 [Pseudomonas moraviensis]
MTINQTPHNNVLALNPPRAPEATRPVIGADYGVPIHVYDLKPMGLTIKVDPPLAGTVKEGDVIRLWLNNARTDAIKTIGPGEENDIHTLYLPKGLLLTNRLNTLVFTITRGSQNEGTSTPELTLLYNDIRPGMEDQTPGDRAHSELHLILPDDVRYDGIDAERAKEGVQVCFAYPYCRAHDVIRLNCNGKDVVRIVAPGEAPATPSAERTMICVMVGEEVFQQAGDSPNFVFSYTVTDQLGNGPDADSPYSGTVEIDVHLKEPRLVAPDLAEDPDDPSDDPSTIDLAKLGSKDLTVLVHAFAPTWQPNDKIRVTYTATKPAAPVVTHIVEADVGRIPFTYKLMVPNAKVIAGSVVRAKYELVRGGITIATSKTTTADVIGGSTIVLLPPFLVAPAVDPIDVLAYPNGVTVRIEYLGALKGDRARLVEVNAPAGSPQFPLVEFNAYKRVNTLLSQAFLAARHGKEITLRWNLNRNGGQAGKSPVATFSVLKVSDGDSRLPAFRIDEANGATHVLSLKDFQGNCTVSIAPSPLIIAGHYLWLDIALNKSSAQPIVIPLARGDIINTEEQNTGVRRILLRSDLENLQHESTLELVPKIFFSSNPTEEHSTKLPTTDYILHNPTLFIEEDFSNVASHKLNVGQSINIGTMTLTNIREDSVSGDYTGIGHPLTVGWGSQCLKIRDTIKIDLNGKTATEIDWTVLNSQTNNGITFYNAAGILIHSVADLTIVPIKLPNNLKFSSLIITTQIVPGSGGLRDYLDIDNIKITLSN